MPHPILRNDRQPIISAHFQPNLSAHRCAHCGHAMERNAVLLRMRRALTMCKARLFADHPAPARAAISSRSGAQIVVIHLRPWLAGIQVRLAQSVAHRWCLFAGRAYQFNVCSITTTTSSCSPLTCTILSGQRSCSDKTDSLTLNDGDLLFVSASVTGSPPQSTAQWSLDFVPSAP